MSDLLEPWKIGKPGNDWESRLRLLAKKYNINDVEIFLNTIYEHSHNKAWIDFIDSMPHTANQKDELHRAINYATKLQTSIHKIVGDSSPINSLPAHDTSLSAINCEKTKTTFALSQLIDAKTLLKETDSQLALLINRLNEASVVMETARSKKGRKNERGTNLVISNLIKYWENELGRDSRVKHNGFDDSYHGQFLELTMAIFQIIKIPFTSQNALGKKIYILLKKEN